MLDWLKQESIEGLVTWPDHEDITTYYVMPKQPEFRLDDNGLPVFKFVKYRNPLDRPGGKVGGGFLTFVAELVAPEDRVAAVKAHLQERLNQQWQDEGRQPPAPPIKIGQPGYLRGTASVEILDGDRLFVEKIRNPAGPSLYGNMVAPFAVEFSPEGATLAEQALQGGGGFVQVVYDLWLPVRLPSVTATVWFDASKFLELHQQVDFDERFWGEDSHRLTIREEFRQSEAGGVEIEPGAVTDEKVLGPVREWAMSALEDAVTRMVLPGVPPMDRDAARRMYEEQGIQNLTLDAVYSFRRTYTEGQVMEWNPKPQGFLPGITGLTDKAGNPLMWEDFSAVVDVGDDPFWRTLDVTVRANADFATLPLDSVEAQLRYRGDPQNTVSKEILLQSPDDVGWFSASIENDNREYEYSYQVNYKDSDKRYESPPTTTDEGILTINVGDTGVLVLDVAAGGLSFGEVDRALVSLRYEDQRHNVKLMVQAFTLDEEHREHRWARVLLKPRRNPFRYRVKYFMKDGKEYQTDWRPHNSSKLFVDDPFVGRRTIGVRGFGDFDDEIEAIHLNLFYKDEKNDYSRSHATTLSKDRTSDDWFFPVISDTGGKVTYSGAITYRNKVPRNIPITEAKRDTILVGDMLFEQEISVVADLVDFSAARLVTVALRYGDERNRIAETGGLLFKEDTDKTQAWSFSFRDQTRKAYEWRASYFMANGSVRTHEWRKTGEKTLVLPERPGRHWHIPGRGR